MPRTVQDSDCVACDNARIVAEESESQQLEHQAVWWLVVFGAGIGIAVGSVLAIGLLRIWRPSAIKDFCGFIGFVVCAVGVVMSVFCSKKAEWAKDDTDRTK